MTDEWKDAYKKVYGKSPGKADYTFAPNSIAKTCLESTGDVKKEEQKRNLFAPVKLKRPAQYSPVKQVIKKRAVQPCEDDVDHKPVAVSLRMSPRKKIVHIQSSPGTFAPISGSSCFKSPTKMIMGDEGTSSKLFGDTVNLSPQKPLSRSKVMISCADTLYEIKSPVKKKGEIKENTLDEFAVEDEAMKDLRPKIMRKKNGDKNFLKLNMKKGYHAKGKLTAQQKRKFKKKANYKKISSGH
ncbi:sld-2 [Pristionchus pacificus]|uniref:Sld-2 n=1 Tax=Pristionchus pacificus TaxID=54126 RepID=A0A2A6CCV1_PRIPA|nr:sld-2 [Pristionchus pacificus]|eukprot:PDM75946.1 sld-2 [Pristionchus pacificus]